MIAGTAGRGNPVARALVRILDRSVNPADRPSNPVGFGLLASTGMVVTCAHVVAQSLGEEWALASPPDRRVFLDFPFLEPRRTLTARVVAWLPWSEDGTGDIAGLMLDDEAPGLAVPLALARAGSVSEHDFVAYGYRGSVGTPVWVPGRIVERTERGLLQLGLGELTGGLRIREGFSGTPVWDMQVGQVVGLVSAGSIGRSEWLAYAVSGEMVFEAWPDLRESFQRACPFRGLMSYGLADSDIFFGRNELGITAVATIARSEQTLISGASGAGKTSLVHAAVIPELMRQGHAVLAIRSGGRDSLWAEIAAALVARDEASAYE